MALPSGPPGPAPAPLILPAEAPSLNDVHITESPIEMTETGAPQPTLPPPPTSSEPTQPQSLAPPTQYPPAPPLNSASSGLEPIRQDPMEPDYPVRPRGKPRSNSYLEPVPHSERSLASYMAKHPHHPVKKAIRKLYPRPNCFKRLAIYSGKGHSVIKGLTAEELKYWEAKGPELRRKAGWKLPGEDGPGVEVSDLFWKMYLSIQPTIERDQLSGMTAPDLIGSTTTMPLSIVSLIPDIMQHYRSVIIRAQKEVFLATNYWQASDSVTVVKQALIDLSAKIIKEGRPKVVVKIMYDRGTWEQLYNPHAFVGPKGFKPLDMPMPEEIPGLHLEVINYHRVLLGTFHVKFLIVDRKVVLLNSNNIQDRPNLEMMTHLEGPIVDTFYDCALYSWYNTMTPPLPCLAEPYQPPRNADGEVTYLFKDLNPYFRDIEVLKAARAARAMLRRQTQDNELERARYMDHNSHTARDRLVEAVRQAVANQRQSFAQTQGELATRGAIAMKELREFGERMGFPATSRPGSRRASATDLTKLHRGDYDEETAAITAANRKLTMPVASSEATTSPTLHEFPVRSKTMPAPHQPFDSDLDGTTTAQTSVRQSFHSAYDGPEDHRRVGFAADRTESPPPLVASVTDSPEQLTRELPPAYKGDAEKHANGGPFAGSPSSTFPRNHESPFKEPESPFKDGPELDHRDIGDSHVIDEKRFSRLRGDHSGDITPRTERSFRWADRWHEDLDSGTATPYHPRQSIDEEIPPEGGTKRMFKLSKRFNAGALSEAWATVEDSDELDNFNPHIIHEPHDPFPCALVCRRPMGMPGHHDISNPQNAAWLAGMRYAKHKIFIQTPTLNARPLVRAVKQACRRGVEVILLLDLGFNDMAESIAFQGGTNEQVVDRLYKLLIKEGKAQHLKVYWYTGKDQVRPLNAVKKQRNCHIKFAAYDDEVMILGNANGDTQSVFHSSEVNIMIDSKERVREMMETLLSNQNTMKYGGVDADGVWRDEEGKTLVDYGATGGGGFMSGVSAFIRFAKTAAK